ncbi:hypothetical protein PsorP6_007050 [Peronosclerospora sorghi]|uniref:Uncharacterized protein n=1 Tax=Peronosclerospora sorghi TaxID=230839 RepID=A0ACC0WAP8_9STRA|nr:hypothetical protein PsorP6_007050 [Peronosclerospora sorghi]
MALEPVPVFPTPSMDDLEPMESELPSLFATDEMEMLQTSIETDDCTHTSKLGEDLSPLHSTPTAVDYYNPSFSHHEVLDLISLFVPKKSLPIPTIVRSHSEPIKSSTKRTKKCTYAARRKEVSLLRHESMVLEKRLSALRKLRAVSSQISTTVASEKYNLAKAQEENKRLRFLVSNQEAKIRQVDAYMVTATDPHALEHVLYHLV